MGNVLKKSLNSPSRSCTNNIVESNQKIKFKPNFADVIIVYKLLCKYNITSLYLPPEIIMDILHFSDYNPQTIVYNNQSIDGSNNQNQLYLTHRMKKMRYFSPCKIIIIVESKDQGWSSYPARHGQRDSNTWGEVALSNMNDRFHVYRNIHAGKEFEIQSKMFDKESELLILLISNLNTPIGDGMFDYSQPYPTTPSIQFYIRSQYPGWANKVENAKIVIDWEYNDNWNEINI